MTLTEAELTRALRSRRVRPFQMPNGDWATLKGLVGADPTRYQTFTHEGRDAILRDNRDGTYTLFVQD